MKLTDALPKYSGGVRETIVRSVRRSILDFEDERPLGVEVDAVALRVRRELESGHESICAQYGFMQFLLDITRKELAVSYGHESQETCAIQHDAFTGQLQMYYPIPHKRNEKPVYVLLDALTIAQLRWNAEQHRKVGYAHQRHADALDAYADRKASGASAA